MANEDVREFQKYKTRGAYHWEQISNNLLRRNTFILGRYNNVINLLKNKIGSLNGKKILDVGCGDGVLSYLVAKQGAEVSGIGYSDIAIEFAKEKSKRLKIDFKQGSAYELPFKDNSFDAVISSDVIEHLEDVPTYLSEINRVCKNGGTVVITTPIKYTEIPLDPEHVIEWFPNEFKNVISSQFKSCEFKQSHSLVLHEIIQAQLLGKRWYNLIFNILSFIHNPFDGFINKFKQNVLQYAVIKVVK
jgi:ubiquinone biosynthesis O-methyltransferase